MGGVPAAPRLDERLRGYVAGSAAVLSAAELTRGAGELAWALGLPRPSYQQVRLLARAASAERPRPAVQTTRGRVVLRQVVRAIDTLYEYPAPGLADWYSRYSRGL